MRNAPCRRLRGGVLSTEVFGQIVTPEAVFPGRVVFDQRIVSIEPLPDAPRQWILPGALDWHNHGGGGGDVMEGESGIRALARTHAQFGMTGFLATTVTADQAAITQALHAARVVMDNPGQDEARCHGVHLEGPYLSPGKLGAQPPMTRPVDARELRDWLQLGVIRVITYAPEMDPDCVLPDLADEFGVRLQLGHTACAYHDALMRLQSGHGVTHLYNAMSGVSHREPGMALAALNHAQYCEIICDGVHVEAPAFELARRQIPKLYAVTDATAASGMPDGSYALGTHSVCKVGDAVRLADGTLAGSAATAVTGLQTLLQFGMDVPEVAAIMAQRPAEWLGLTDRGALALGNYADLWVWDGHQTQAVWLEGRLLSTNSR